MWKQPGRCSGSYYQFSNPATSLKRPCIQLLCAECHAPCQWNLATEQDEPADLQYQVRGCGHGKVKRAMAKLELEDLNLILRQRRLRWFGHVERSSGAGSTACDIQIDGRQGAGRSKLTWKKLTEKDYREWKLRTVDPQERKSAMRAASQLPGRGPTDVDDVPVPAC